MRIAASLGFFLSLGLASGAVAGTAAVSSELRQRALDDCTGDAMRLCPLSLTDEASAVSCMATKRPQLSPACRIVYDQVARVLKP